VLAGGRGGIFGDTVTAGSKPGLGSGSGGVIKNTDPALAGGKGGIFGDCRSGCNGGTLGADTVLAGGKGGIFSGMVPTGRKPGASSGGCPEYYCGLK
jgi:hypothetical protein